MNKNPNILISGGGIAGLTLAYWLKTFGFQPSIVEKRPDLRDEGYMIDFWGSGFDVAEKMGLHEQLAARHYPIPNLDFVDARGSVRAIYQIEAFRKLVHYRHFNFMRGDLENVLYKTVQDQVPIRFQCSITQLQEQAGQVEVTFSDGSQKSYDLVIGADGIHSLVRQLLWGPEEPFSHYLGYYAVCSTMPNFLGDLDTFFSYLEPHRQVSAYPIRDNQLATFMIFPSEKLGHLSYPQQLDCIKETFRGMGWIVPGIVDRWEGAQNHYFDSVTQIKLSDWYKGRVALVGDACQCLTLLAGQGASMAMAGAYILANELHQAQGDYPAAFQAYQAKVQPEIAVLQKKAEKMAKTFVPGSRMAIWLTILFLKVAFFPGFRSLLLSQIGAKSIIK